jgi:hypothetical protein
LTLAVRLRFRTTAGLAGKPIGSKARGTVHETCWQRVAGGKREQAARHSTLARLQCT